MGTKTRTMSRPFAMVMAAILAGAMAIALGLSLGASQAYAGGVPGTPNLADLGGKSYTVTYKGKNHDNGYRSYSSLQGSKMVTAAKSSNKKVATVRVLNYENAHALIVNINGVGTTKISYKLGGKKHTVKYIVKGYENPIKSFKIGSKNYAACFKPSAISKYSGQSVGGYAVAKSFKGKVSLKLAKGWTLGKGWIPGAPIKYYKNGSKINGATTVGFYLKKGKQREIFFLTATTADQYKSMMAASI